MNMDADKIDFVRSRIPLDGRLRRWAAGELVRLHDALARDEESAMPFRFCSLPEDLWRLLRPIAISMADGRCLPKEHYWQIVGVMIENAGLIAALMPDGEYLAAMEQKSSDADDADDGDGA